MKISKEIESIFIFLSTIIGLGVFVLPYAFLQGKLWFIFWLGFWFIVFYIIHLIFAEIIFQTKEKHNLPGLAAIYLHPNLKHLVWIFDYFGMMGVFWIYLLSLEKFWGTIFPDKTFLVKLIFVFFNLFFITKNLKIFAGFETILGISIIFLFLIISFWFGIKADINNFTNLFNFQGDFFLPYGVLLFAFSGISAVPLVFDLVGKEKEKFRKINLFSLVLVTSIYLFYSLSIIGFLGNKTSEISLDVLKPFIPLPLFLFILILVTFNIMLVDLAFYLKRGLQADYGLSERRTNLILIFSILLLLFLPANSLIKIISLISDVFLGFNLLILNLIYLKLKEKKFFIFPKFLIIFISLILFLGMIYEIF
ncbi:hypothetical protein HRbin35_00347 [bacterium HR35]|nr:hypothetical protein HRbin35_00347 [bacterium HR35]